MTSPLVDSLKVDTGWQGLVNQQLGSSRDFFIETMRKVFRGLESVKFCTM